MQFEAMDYQDWVQTDWDDAWVEQLASMLGKPKNQVTPEDLANYAPDGEGGIKWVD